MIDPRHFERIRIVRDRTMEEDKPLPKDEEGTKVLSDPLQADEGTLFPLQGALAYDMTQTLFIGPNSLIIEGVSDLIYLSTISDVFQRQGRTGLDPRWTLTPVGGVDKVATFVALFRSQKNLNIATLLDLQKKDTQKLEGLYKQKLLKKQQVLTFADFTKTAEADIEDMFDPEFYIDLVNAEYALELSAPINLSSLPPNPRIVMRIEKYVESNPLKTGVSFNHYRPARYLAEKIKTLGPKIDRPTLDRFEVVFKTLNGLL